MKPEGWLLRLGAVDHRCHTCPVRRREVGDETALEAGDFADWRARLLDALERGAEMDVPCGSCTACCRSSMFVHVEPDEVETLRRIPRALLVPAPGRPNGHLVMGHDEAGRCPMLGDDGCTIYEHRPRACRTYDCRVYTAVGLRPSDDGKPLIEERTTRWRFSFTTDADRVAHEAVTRAVRFLAAEGANAPAPAVQVALAAIRDVGGAPSTSHRDVDDESARPPVGEAVDDLAVG